VLHLFGDHRETVGQNLAADMSDVFYHLFIEPSPGELRRSSILTYCG
jgi:hypothetical protein